MNARLPLLLAAALSILSLAPAHGATVELFHETFNSNDKNWNNGSAGASTYDQSGWTESGSVRAGKSGVLLGTANATGTITTREIAIENEGTAANLVITIQAAGYSGGGANPVLSVTATSAAGSESWTQALTANPSNTEVIPQTASYVFQFTTYSPTSSFKLTLTTGASAQSNYRTMIGDVLVEQIVSTGIPPLSAPENLSSSNADYSGFILSWDSVAGATGYSVTVKNENESTVFTTSCSSSETTANVTNLAPGGTYTAYVTALGDGTTNDDSAPAELADITTLASVPLSAPTGLASSNIGYFGFSLSWTAVSGATDYTVTLSPAGSVSVDGTTATATGLSEGVTYTASVVAKGNGIATADSPAATLDVTTATAPAVSAPVLTASGVSPSSFTVSWPAQNDASFSVRAWTLVPANTATEDFAGYPEVEPEGWTFNGTEANTTASAASHPVAFKSSCSMVSPVYPSDISSLSFDLQHGNATSSSFAVFGSDDGGETWTPLVEYSNAGTHISNGEKTISISTPGIRQIKFVYTKSSGNLYLGSFSVTGTDIGKQPSYLTGYGPDPVVVGATSVTISNPVKGEKNYVEVTATGLSGRTATSTLPVFVPGYPAVITVK